MRRVVLLAGIWGWSFLLIKVAVAGMTPATVAAARITFGMVVVLAALKLRRTALPRDARSWRAFAFMAVLANVVPFTLLAWGEERTTSALASVMNASTALFTAIAVAVFLGERLKPVQIAGLLTGFAGVAVAAGVEGADIAASSWTGSLASVGAAAFYGLGFVYAQRRLSGMPPLVASGGQLVAGTVISAPIAAYSSITGGISLTPTRVVAVLVLGALGTGFAYLLYYRSLAALGPTRTSLVTYLVPPVAIAVGVAFLDERLELRLLAGTALIVLGILAVQERLRRVRPIPAGVAAVVALVLGVGFAGCGGGDDAASGCGPVVQEVLDPNSARHLLPGAAEPKYSSEPPTSGAHPSAGNPTTGVRSRPIPRPIQVQLLEIGEVLVQHSPTLDAESIRRIRSLAMAQAVTVAPNPDLPAPVVATAWTFKQLCDGTDDAALESLQKFANAHAGPARHQR